MADEQTTPTKQLILQKIYVKDLSFESPKAPDVFRTETDEQTQTQLNMRSGHTDIGGDNVEVTLTMTAEAKLNEDTLFLVEITQAGVFLLQGYTAEERQALIGSYCPATLYPYAREAIADLSTRGGFPPLLMQPINFDALYAQALREREQQQQQAQAAQAAPQPLIDPSEAH